MKSHCSNVTSKFSTVLIQCSSSLRTNCSICLGPTQCSILCKVLSDDITMLHVYMAMLFSNHHYKLWHYAYTVTPVPSGSKIGHWKNVWSRLNKRSQRDGSLLKCMCCSFRGLSSIPATHSQLSFPVSLKFSSRGIWPGLCRYLNSCEYTAHHHTCTHIIKNNRNHLKILYKIYMCDLIKFHHHGPCSFNALPRPNTQWPLGEIPDIFYSVYQFVGGSGETMLFFPLSVFYCPSFTAIAKIIFLGFILVVPSNTQFSYFVSPQTIELTWDIPTLTWLHSLSVGQSDSLRVWWIMELSRAAALWQRPSSFLSFSSPFLVLGVSIPPNSHTGNSILNTASFT